jgi:uncharacterized protein
VIDESLLRALGSAGPEFEQAVVAARADRARLCDAFVEVVEDYLAGEAPPAVADALFLIVHLLGEWSQTTAYRPLCALLRLPADEVEMLMGDAITETLPRIMAAVFDGDLAPLQAVILDSEADEFVRSAMFTTLVALALRGVVPRPQVAKFLLECEAQLEPRAANHVWFGWQDAVSHLGLAALRPLVERGFRLGYIDPVVMRFEEFEEELERSMREGPEAAWRDTREYAPFVDTVEALRSWSAFQPTDERRRTARPRSLEGEDAPKLNPFRDVGRNDSCPCGSGAKFKRCCLNSLSAS